MTTIYHNPRCSKSRACLALVQQKIEEVKVIQYMKTPPSVEELTAIIERLGIQPMELVRTNEALWKEHYKGNTYTDQELIEIMCAQPKLIERPIVLHHDKAVIGRPPELVLDIV